MFARAKGKQQKQVRQLHCQEQCIDHIPYYLSGLSRAIFFPTNFLEIAVYYFLWYSDPSEQMDQSSILIYIRLFEVPRDQGKERIGCPLYIY